MTPLSRHRLLASRLHRVELAQDGSVVLDEEFTLADDEERAFLADISTLPRGRRTAPGSAIAVPDGTPAIDVPTGAASTTDVGSSDAVDPAATAGSTATADAPTPTDATTASATTSSAAADPPAGEPAGSESSGPSTGISGLMGRYLRAGADAGVRGGSR